MSMPKARLAPTSGDSDSLAAAQAARNKYLDTKAQLDLLKLKAKQLKLELEQAEAEMDSALFPTDAPLLDWKETDDHSSIY